MADIDVLEGDGVVIVVATVAGQNAFDFDFLAYTGDQVFVTFKPNTVDEVPLSLGVDYSVAGLAQEAGGSITLIGAYAGVTEVDDELLIYRSTPIQRLFDYQNAGDFRAETVNRELDLMIMIDQENRREADRGIKVPLGSGAAPQITPGADGTVPMWQGGNLGSGPSAAQIAAAEGFAEDAQDAALAAEEALAEFIANAGVFVVTSLAALKDIDPTGNVRHVYLDAGGRSGFFNWRTGNFTAPVAADASQGVFVKADDIAASVGAWVRDKVDGVNPRWFGAAWDGATDDHIALEAADNFAFANNLPLVLPAGTGFIGQTFGLGAMEVRGAGKTLTAILHANGRAEPAILIKPSAGVAGDNAFRRYADFSVVPGDATSLSIKVELVTGEYFSHFSMERLCLLGGASASLLFDNTVNNVNGIFCGHVSDCFINSVGGGIQVINGGDSLTFHKNTINGNGIALFVSLVTGARQLLIDENNFTTRGECVYLSGTIGAVVTNNWMETPSYLGSYTGASGAICYLENASNTRIEQNTIQPLDEVGGGFVGANYAITVAGTGDRNFIDDNDLADGILGHIHLTASSVTNTVVGELNVYAEAAFITDNGFATRGVWRIPALTNSWAEFDTNRKPKYKIRPDGSVEFKGAIKTGAIGASAFTLPTDARPDANRLLATMANNGSVDVFASLAVLAATGTVTPSAGSNSYFSLDGLFFQRAI